MPPPKNSGQISRKRESSLQSLAEGGRPKPDEPSKFLHRKQICSVLKIHDPCAIRDGHAGALVVRARPDMPRGRSRISTTQTSLNPKLGLFCAGASGSSGWWIAFDRRIWSVVNISSVAGSCYRLVVPPLAALTIFGCSHAPRPSPTQWAPARDSRRAIEHALHAELANWQGTPYCPGGRTRVCADCSGFVQSVFAAAFGMNLPRTVAEMAACGQEVARSDLRAGDLVFFRIAEKTHHVAIYMRDGQIVHASSSRGIMFSRLDEPYWDRAYIAARRVL